MPDQGKDQNTSLDQKKAKEKGYSDTKARKPLRKRPLISSEIECDNPAYRGDRIALELFRSISIGKMICVVGSGVTIPYGYDSWKVFCEKLMLFLESTCTNRAKPDLISEAAREFYSNQYGKNKSFENLSDDEKLSVFGFFYPHLTIEGKKNLHKKYREWFGLRERLRFSDQKTKKSYKSLAKRLKINAENYFPPDLGLALDLCEKEVNQDILKKNLLKRPSDKISASRNVVDPLKTMRSALRISRFATFNYDLEIEAMLEDLDYPYNILTAQDNQAVHSTQSRLGATARAISLSPNNTSELISIAAMPSSDDALVVHLHGAVTKPDDMTVSQNEYNALYIQDYPGHESFDDARTLMFGGNAVLYVGVGLREEDLMRPLRYLASALPERPIYALVPSMESVEKDKAFVQKIKANYGVNVIPYGWSAETIARAWPIDQPEHILGPEFIALHEELRNVRAALRKILRGEEIDIDIELSKEKSPRLRLHRDFIIVIEHLMGSIQSQTTAKKSNHGNLSIKIAETAFLEILRSTLLKTQDVPAAERKLIRNIIARYDNDIASIRTSLSKEKAPFLNKNKLYLAALNLIEQFSYREAINEKKIIEFFDSIVVGTALDCVLHYLADATQIWRKRWQISGRMTSTPNRRLKVLQSTMPSFLSEDDRVICKDIFDGICEKTNVVSVLLFESGSRKGAFVSYLNDIRESKEAELDIRIYCLEHNIAPNSLLSIIFNLEESQGFDKLDDKENVNSIIFIKNAERLLDEKSKRTKSLLVERILDSLKKLEKNRVVFLTGKKSAAHFFSGFFDVETSFRAIKPVVSDIQKKFERFSGLKSITSNYRWPNKVIEGMLSRVHKDNQDAFLGICNRTLESRLSNIAIEYQRSAFCGAMLDSHHIWVREHGTKDERILVVLSHAILKWMFAIHIPVDQESIESILEIKDIAKTYHQRTKNISNIVDSSLMQLESFGLIYGVFSEYGGKKKQNRNRYILHSKVRSYLAHKRGLSHGWMDHREWNTVTLCNAIAEGGPLFNRKDYEDACSQFDAFIDDFHQTGGQSQHGLRCAYALVRGHLYAHNAIRAGVAFLPEHHPLSVLEDHVGRISRLRSASSYLEEEKRPHFYEFFDLWAVNEIAVMRYIQGNFHDCVMLFREALNFCEKNPSQNGVVDPALAPRIRINLALSLVERARFDEALEILSDVHAALDDLVDEGLAFSPTKPILYSLDAAEPVIATPDNESGKKVEAPRSFPKKNSVPVQFSISSKAGDEQNRGQPHPEYILLRALAYGCQAQIELLTANLDRARESISSSLDSIDKVDMLGVRGWLHGIAVQIASASGELETARTHLGRALAAARGSLRPDLIMALEIAKTEFEMRDASGSRETALEVLAHLTEIEKTVHTLGSQKARVSILLIRARVLLYMGQVDSARVSALDAICLSLLNGMRLKRITGLILMSAIMAMRGETSSAKDLLRSTRLTAMKIRYIRAVLDIDRLEHAIDLDGGVAQWAGYLSEFDVSALRGHIHDHRP